VYLEHLPRSDPLPVEAARDLLGIARALYAARKREFASRAELEELATIGKQLANALRLAKKSSPDTLAHRAAWLQAEDACSRLLRLISLSTPAAAVVEAAVVRVRRIGPRPPSEREERRAAAKARS
jgi:hypothetical protein